MRKISHFLFTVTTLILFSGCEAGKIYEKHQDPSSELEWHSNDTISFEVDIADTLEPYDVFFALRFAQGFPLEKLKVELNHLTPDGRQRYSMHEITVAENGQYIGKGMGDIWDLEQRISTSEGFDAKGVHVLKFTPSGPIDPVPLVMEVGLVIREKSE